MLLDGQGIAFEQAVQLVRQYLPRNGILVGQNIGKDVDWLQLREGQDFQVSKLRRSTYLSMTALLPLKVHAQPRHVRVRAQLDGVSDRVAGGCLLWMQD